MRGGKNQTQGVLTSSYYDDLLFIIYSYYDFSIDNKSSSDTDESSGSEVAFAVVVVVVMLQALSTISVLVASKKMHAL